MSDKLILMVAVAAAASCGDDGTIAGTITGAAGVLVNAEVTAAGRTVASAADGTYELADVAPGAVEVSVVADWYADGVESADVASGKTTTVDFQLMPAALRVETADATLATTFNASDDWTGDAVSIAHVSAPTRALLELAIHYRNPALYRDPSGENPLTPTPLPTIVTPTTFDFPFPAGSPQEGQQALDVSSIENDVSMTPLVAPGDGLALWEPAVEQFLLDWSFDDATRLYTAGVAVRAQRWGGDSTLKPQEIERMALDSGDIWVEITFRPFVDVAADVTDTNGDGLPEVYARIDPGHFSPTLYAELRDTYVAQTHGTLELAAILDENLEQLYSRGTNANVINSIGVPYTHTDLGTVEYPFAVVLHGSIMVTNVFLVAP